MKKTFICNAFSPCFLGSLSAQINIQSGQTLTQDFDVLGTSATATMPASWKVDKNTTVRLVGNYSAAVTATERTGGNSMTDSAGNGIYNFGAGDPTTATDRAVGFLSSSSATKSGNVYVQLVISSTTINSLLSVIMWKIPDALIQPVFPSKCITPLMELLGQVQEVHF